MTHKTLSEKRNFSILLHRHDFYFSYFIFVASRSLDISIDSLIRKNTVSHHHHHHHHENVREFKTNKQKQDKKKNKKKPPIDTHFQMSFYREITFDISAMKYS